MYHGELIISSGNNLAVTNHCVFSIQQKMAPDLKSMSRVCSIQAQKLFNYDGMINEGDTLDGIIRLQVGEKEELKYFTGVMLSLSMGLATIQLDGELKENNTEQFLKKIERYEFSR